MEKKYSLNSCRNKIFTRKMMKNLLCGGGGGLWVYGIEKQYGTGIATYGNEEDTDQGRNARSNSNKK